MKEFYLTLCGIYSLALFGAIVTFIIIPTWNKLIVKDSNPAPFASESKINHDFSKDGVLEVVIQSDSLQDKITQAKWRIKCVGSANAGSTAILASYSFNGKR